MNVGCISQVGLCLGIDSTLVHRKNISPWPHKEQLFFEAVNQANDVVYSMYIPSMW